MKRHFGTAPGVSLLRRLFTETAGNIAVATAFLMVPLMGVAGLSIDLARAWDLKARLDYAADAAALASVAPNSAVYAYTNGDAGKAVWDQQAADAFAGFRKGYVASLGTTVSTDVQRDGPNITATVSYQATMKTTFATLIGVPTFTISGRAEARQQVSQYYDLHVLLDNSPSMGVGATPEDVAMMQAGMPGGCIFACHDVSGAQDNTMAAVEIGARLRIDAVTEAIGTIPDLLPAADRQQGRYRLALYSLGASAEAAAASRLTVVQAPTTSVSAFATAVESVGLMSVPFMNYNGNIDSDLRQALSLLNARLPSGGDGTGASSPKQVILLVSDGVTNFFSTQSGCYGRNVGSICMAYLDTSICDTIKARGIQIAVLYTTYVPVTSSAAYKYYIQPQISRIEPAMRACASPGFYAEGGSAADLQLVLKSLILGLVSQPRLTM